MRVTGARKYQDMMYRAFQNMRRVYNVAGRLLEIGSTNSSFPDEPTVVWHRPGGVARVCAHATWFGLFFVRIQAIEMF